MRYLCCLGLAAAWSITKGGAAIAGGEVGDRVSFSSIRESGPLELGPKRSLDIGFQVVEAPPVPRQAMVKVGDQLFSAKFRGKNAKIVVPHASLESGDGTFPVEVVIGSTEGEPLREYAFDVKVFGLESSVSSQRFEKLPEIYHQFKPSPRTVNPLIALLFCGIIDFALAALFYSWKAEIGCKSPSSTMYPFLASIVAAELAFVGYFISWSIFRLLGTLGILSPFMLVTGRTALRALSPTVEKSKPIMSLGKSQEKDSEKSSAEPKQGSRAATQPHKSKGAKR